MTFVPLKSKSHFIHQMTRKQKEKRAKPEMEEQAINPEDIDYYINQTRLRDRIMKEMIKKLQESSNHNNSKE